MYVLENPIDPAYFDIQSNEVGHGILTVGTIIRRKNLLDLIRVLKRLRTSNVQLRIVGVIEEKYYYEQVIQCVRDEHLESSVQFLGRPALPELLREYANCAVVASASSEEFAGLSLEQAMAAGKAVVATRTGGIPTVVRDGECGLLSEPGNVEEMADHLDRVFSDGVLRSSLGACGRKEALSRFSPDVAAAKTHAIYQRMLGTL
jgi:glycosyltransferase involved in cell wall biosynthesis